MRDPLLGRGGGRRRDHGSSIGRLLTLLAVAVLSLGALAEPGAAGTVVAGPVTVATTEDSLLRVGPDRHYRGALEFLPRDQGLLLVNDLELESYVTGVAEMPARWPMEALKAQAVAARTYAWYVMEQGSHEHYDICATTACQRFHGADVVLGDGWGDRWQQAVEETAGEVLVDDEGEPILARYFSTSGGRTYANQEVFPSSGSHDELRAVEDPYDEVSPYHRWTTRFTRAEFDAILSRGDTLHAAVPVASARRLGTERDPGASIEVTGADGAKVVVGAVELRSFLSRMAPQLFPDRFPGLRSDGLRSLPTTVPSSRFGIEVRDDEVVLHGQGWGHGVGMGQYGARGRADAGHSYQEILAAYYGGLRPTRPTGLPDRIRVGIELEAPVKVTADARFSIQTPDGAVEDSTLGSWTVGRQEAGLELAPPPEHDDPLAVAPLRSVSGALADSGVLAVETELSKAALLRLEVTDAAGGVVLRRDLGALQPGTQAVTWSYERSDGEPVAPGRYVVALVAEDAQGTTERTSMEVTVGTGTAAGGGSDLASEEGGGAPVALVVALAAAVSLPLSMWLMIRSRR